MSLVGAKVLRKEDPSLLTGRGKFVDDFSPPNTAFAQFVMSDQAHANIISIDVSETLKMPGVLGVWTAADFISFPNLPGGMTDFERPILAHDRVRWAGEPVAIIVAENRYQAADAVPTVVIKYKTLDAVTSVAQATAPGAPLLFEEHRSNVLTKVPMLDDLEKHFAKSHDRASLRIVNQRCAVVPIETVGCLADWTLDGLTIWATTQAPHHLRNKLASWLDTPQNLCRVIAPDVGGGFGAKIVWYPEFFAAPLLSKWLRRPVKFMQTRS